MPRYQRKKSASGIYHVILRGNERKDIFIDEDDKNRFLYTLERMKGKGNYYLYAYCLMDNHVHLLLAEGKDRISRIMKRIGVSYAYYFNHKYARIGHLFQDRFKSEVIDKDSYLLSAVRYIHNNPVKAGLVKRPGEYKWSSYNIYVSDHASNNDLIEKEQFLGLFPSNKENSIKQFIEYTNEFSEGSFIDCEEEIHTKDKIFSDSEINEIINVILYKYGHKAYEISDCKDKALRKMMLREIREKTGASVRQLSRILGISKDLIFRA